MKVTVIKTANVVVALYVALTIAHHLFHQMLTAVNHQVHQVILCQFLGTTSPWTLLEMDNFNSI